MCSCGQYWIRLSPDSGPRQRAFELLPTSKCCVAAGPVARLSDSRTNKLLMSAENKMLSDGLENVMLSTQTGLAIEY